MYKTILMHVNDNRRIERLLVPAVALAEKSEAHLLALSVVPPIAVLGPNYHQSNGPRLARQ